MNTRDILAEQWAAPRERTVYTDGELDECVVYGSAHLERLDRVTWHLSMVREDGTELAVIITGMIEVEERKAK